MNKIRKMLVAWVVAGGLVTTVMGQIDRYPWFEVGAVSFAPQVAYGAGKSPFAVVALDVDEDGRLDLAVPNRDAATVTILLGREGGGFVPSPVEFPWVDCPIGIASGDFNNDRHVDLAVINHLCSTVTIVLGRGDGTWISRIDFPTGREPRSIAAADLDNDRQLDLAIANRLDGTISLLYGRGDGTFRPRVDYPTELNPHAIVAADFNRDGLADLAVASTGTSTVTLYRNRGDGTISPLPPIPAASGSTALAVTDLDRDGKPDIIVVGVVSDGVGVLLGNGDFTFRSQREYATGDSPLDVCIGDFNGDGNPDAVVVDQGPSMVTVLLGKGDGTFARTSHLNRFSTGEAPYGAAVGDFNRDGRPDIATANFVGLSVSVLLSEEPRFADLAVTQTASATSLFAARQMTITVRVTNRGPDPSLEVRLDDLYPSKTRLLSCVASSGAGCNVSENTATVFWRSIDPGMTAEVTLTFVAADDLCDGDQLINSVKVTARTGDPRLDDNSGLLAIPGANLPPTIAGMPDLHAVGPQPGALIGASVSFAMPAAIDNIPGVSVTCSSRSGEIFPLGLTRVTCTATDRCGLTATSGFNLFVWDLFLVDDRNGSLLLGNTFTGDYLFRRGDTGQEYRGRGRVSRLRCEIRLRDDSRLDATLNSCLSRGLATFRPTIIAPVLTISDRWTRDNLLSSPVLLPLAGKTGDYLPVVLDKAVK